MLKLSKPLIVGVAPVGKDSVFAARVIAAHISGYMNLKTEIIPTLNIPSFAYNEKRFQYNAGVILKSYEAMEFEYDKVIAVLNVDIFMPIFTHVFGEAKQGGKCGLVSVFRLKMEQDCIYPAPSLVYERAAKVALHELGHLFNLLHCEDHRCLMHFSGDLCQLDKTPFYFCRYCTAFLQGFYHFKS